MNRITTLSTAIVFALLLATSGRPQGENQHYEKDGLSFDYPANWIATERKWDGSNAVILKLEGRLAQIIIRKEEATGCDFATETKRLLDNLTRRVSIEIQAGRAPKTSPVKTRIGAIDVDGLELTGRLHRKTVTGEAFTHRMNRRFISLVYIQENKDDRAGSAWEIVRNSLKIEPPVLGTMAVDPAVLPARTSGEVLNGKAIDLPAPAYPAIARQAHASGVVVVQVIIDESGSVIAAHAISGHPLLLAVCVDAAKRGQFSPTKLCGEPVRVTGVIRYNFVAP